MYPADHFREGFGYIRRLCDEVIVIVKNTPGVQLPFKQLGLLKQNATEETFLLSFEQEMTSLIRGARDEVEGVVLEGVRWRM
jgi:hypothetical protein